MRKHLALHSKTQTDSHLGKNKFTIIAILLGRRSTVRNVSEWVASSGFGSTAAPRPGSTHLLPPVERSSLSDRRRYFETSLCPGCI